MTPQDSTPTRRERKLARADRLRDWADGREAKADAAHARTDGMREALPFGQPILVGHHSEKRHRAALDRQDRAMRSYSEHSEKAESHRSKAANIEAAVERSVFSDDPDAAERLEARITENEAKRDEMKAANAAFRKQHGAAFRALNSVEKDNALPFASFTVKNLSASIARDRKRLQGMA